LFGANLLSILDALGIANSGQGWPRISICMKGEIGKQMGQDSNQQFSISLFFSPTFSCNCAMWLNKPWP